jgi:AraC-like DNA-binding protein
MHKAPAMSDIKYLTINENDIHWGLTVTTVGYQHITPNSSYPSREHPSAYLFHPNTGRVLQEYQLIYITSGRGQFRSKHQQNMTVGAGMFLLLFPGEWHSYAPLQETGWHTHWIGFKGAFAANIMRHNFFTPAAPVHHIGFNEQLVGLFREVSGYAVQERAGFQQVISGITMHILGLAYYTIRNNAFADKDIVQQIEKARLLMREDPGGDLRPEAIAQSLNMSYSWFRRMFRQYTGLAPAQYQQQLKLQQAREWLISTDKTVKEIAYILNFESANYFNAFFKQKTGMTPQEFRRASRLVND